MADPSLDNIAKGLTYFVVLLFSLSFHESAHAWMASRLGDDTARNKGRVSLNPLVHIDLIGTVIFPLIQIFAGTPLLGWAKPTPYDPHNFRPGELRRGHMLVAVAGPLSNFVLASGFTAALFVAARTLSRGDATGPLRFVLGAGMLMNVALGVFNLVPIPPLDGSKIAVFGLPAALGAAYDRLVTPYGTLILVILVVSRALTQVVSPVIFFLYDVLVRIALP